MIVDSRGFGAAEAAADIAAILTERGLGGDSVDLDARLDQFRRDRSQRASSARDMARRWAAQVASPTEQGGGELSTGVMLAFAFPDRVARNRGNGSFVLANGRGAAAEQTSALARMSYIAVGELAGVAASGRILLAAPISQDEIELHFADHIETVDEISFDRGAMALRARRKRTLHAITLSEAPLALSPSAETAKVFADGLIAAGLDRLPWSKAAKQFRDRVMFLRKAQGNVQGKAQGNVQGESWPDLSDDALAARREEWLVPLLADKTSLKDVSVGDLSEALMALVPWDLRARLEREAPTHFEAPTGTMLAIDYEAEQGPTIAVRLQELFGLNTHPSIAKGAVPLVLELLSPAQRPVQVTRDLPGFWRGSYAAVRSDLRGRYPRHPWPEDPATALPTRRVKPRGT
jgi:ATP-dependent helicase HrpB